MRYLLPLVLCTFFLVPPVVAEEREYIYGAELMTPKERDVYRRSIQQENNDEARDKLRQRHRERLQKRAQHRGKQLDDKGIVHHQRVGQ
jgi:hypothetical protein